MRGEIEGVLPCQPLGELGVASLQSLNDFQVIDDRARSSIALCDGSPTYRAHMQEKLQRGEVPELRMYPDSTKLASDLP